MGLVKKQNWLSKKQSFDRRKIEQKNSVQEIIRVVLSEYASDSIICTYRPDNQYLTY